MWIILIAFVLHWYLSLFFQSLFHHRYAAHGQFTMSRWMEKLCFIGSYIFMGSNYLSPYGYGVMHRMHHSYADTEKDPHSPSYSKNIFDMMWQTKQRYSDIANRKVEVDERFTKGVPEWKWFDDFARSWFSRLAWSAAYIWFYIEFVPEGMWYLYLLLPINLFMSPVHGAIINWYAHIVGYRNYKQDNTSRNLLPVDFLMWGESYHNNHHMHGNSANFGGVRWHEIDPLYLIIKGMNKIGLITLVKNEPVIKKNAKKAAA